MKDIAHTWTPCAGTGGPPARQLAPARTQGKPGTRTFVRIAARGRCPKCRRDVAMYGDPPALVAHAPYHVRGTLH